MPVVMGVDPGVKGGIVIVRGVGGVGEVLHVAAFKPGMTHEEAVMVVRNAVSILGLNGGSSTIYIEKVGYMRGDGGKGSFTFGQVDGLIRGTLHTLFGRFWTPLNVSPMAWQSALECLSGGNKALLKRKAEALWPAPLAPWTLSTCDAALIAEYGRRRQIRALLPRIPEAT